MLGDSVRRRQRGKRSSRPRAGTGAKSWKAWLAGGLIALTLPFAIGYLIAVRVLFPPPPVSSAGIAVPDLNGRTAAGAARLLDSLGLGPIEQTELPHPTVPAGQIVAQSPLPGQQLRAGGTVTVALSAGRPRVMVPDVIGFGAERAASMLQRSGFAVAQTTEETYAAPGHVLRTEPSAGQIIELPASITIYVGVAVPIDTVPRDTTAFSFDGGRAAPHGAVALSLYRGRNWRIDRKQLHGTPEAR